MRKLANVFEEEIIQGRFSPFDGEIRKKRGRLKGDDSGSLDMFQIVKMDWLNDNVIGKIPGIGAFKEDARELLSALGVEAARTEGEYNENFDCS